VQDIVLFARVIIVHAENFVPFGEQGFAQVRTEKARSSRDQDAFAAVHADSVAVWLIAIPGYGLLV
jgi:hypothetical protein